MRDFPQSMPKIPAPARVLIVDDESLIRWSVAVTLAERGYEVVEAGDAAGARSAIRDPQGRFDVVLLDLRLPDSHDLTLLESIRRLSPDAQVILMTAFGGPEVVRGALDIGAYRVMNKPFEMHALADLVAEAAAAGRPRAETH